jgi:Divergent InlB B-repeat domain/Bacterial Ig-like domain (group 2)
MNRKWFAIAALIIAAISLLIISSCADPQELVSISVQPTTETFGASNIPVNLDAGLTVQLRALGSYLHPPVTKDITNQVTWASNDTQMVTVNSTGLATATGVTCGGTLISATVTTNHDGSGVSSSGAVVTGYMTANVTCFTGNGSGSGPALTLTFAGNGAGTVTSSPTGLSCSSPSPCVGEFPSGTEVTLTATPNSGSKFGNWLNCDTPASTNPCTVTLTANETVTVTFN